MGEMIGLVISLSSVGKHIEYLLADSDTILILVLRVKGETSICTDERFGDTALLSVSSWWLSGSESVGNSIRDRRYLRFAWGNDAAVGCDDHGSSNFVRLEQADDDYSNQGEKIRAKKKLPANTVIFETKKRTWFTCNILLTLSWKVESPTLAALPRLEPPFVVLKRDLKLFFVPLVSVRSPSA
jgi:hypothetical protein